MLGEGCQDVKYLDCEVKDRYCFVSELEEVIIDVLLALGGVKI